MSETRLGFVDEDTFFEISSDNRLTIWGVNSGEVKAVRHEKDHLSSDYQCCDYGKRGHSIVAVVGDNKTREITSWDLTTGKCEGFPAPINHEISDICFSNDRESVFCCGKMSKYAFQVILDGLTVSKRWKVKTGYSKIRVSPCGTYLLVAGTGIALWSLETDELVKSFAGHSSPVKFLEISKCGKYFVSACEDNFVYLWDTTVDESLVRTPLKIFSMPSAPRNVVFHSEDGADIGDTPSKKKTKKSNKKRKTLISSSFSLGVCGDDGNGYLWFMNENELRNNKQEDGNAKVKSDCTLTVGDQANGVKSIDFRNGGKQAVVVRTTPLRPIFETVDLYDQHNELKQKVALGDVSKEGRLLAAKNVDIVKDTNKMDVDEDDEDNQADGKDQPKLNRLEQLTKKKEAEKLHIVKSESALAHSNPQEMKGQQQVDDDKEEDDDDDTLTMAERIERLKQKSAGLKRKHDGDDDEEEDSDNDEDGDGENKKEANGVSVARLMMQALQSNDNQLLEQCLRHRDQTIINATIQRLNQKYVGPLMKQLVTKFENKPGRHELFLSWLTAVLENHADYVKSHSLISDNLHELNQACTRRTAMFPKFQRLSGRLDFILKQAALRSSDQTKKQQGPLAIFDEEA